MADTGSGIDRARGAMARGAWAEAYDAFSAVDRAALTGSDLEGLADAAWWISRLDVSLDARHQAYAAYEQEGDELGAGTVAARLAIEHFVREQPSVGAGYLMRARRHAEHIPPGSEQGFIAMVESNVARFSGDPDGAIAKAREAVEIGRRFGDRDLIAMAIHTEGLARIDAGHAADGMALLDEAMTSVLAGDLDPYFTGIIYCNLIQACLELNDIRRAGEWSDAARAWCDALPPDAPFPGMCRINRAEVARLRGAWPEAEGEPATSRVPRRRSAAHRSSGASHNLGSRTSASPRGRSTPRAPDCGSRSPPSTSRHVERGSSRPRSRPPSPRATSTRHAPRSASSPR